MKEEKYACNAQLIEAISLEQCREFVVLIANFINEKERYEYLFFL